MSPSYEQKLSDAAWGVLDNAEPTPDPTGIVECWLLEPGMKGVSRNKKYANTFKLRVGTSTRLAHRVVYEYYNYFEIDKALDVSHLCHNENCVNPFHLVQESHHDNMKRQRCLGWILNDGKLIKVCNHDPPCKVITVLNNPIVKSLYSESDILELQ
jgi:hypothetical protein